jgi:hypothetical protein
MDNYIELKFEPEWRKPIQAYSVLKIRNKTITNHFFAEWDNYLDALNWLKHGHSKYKIIINNFLFSYL